MAAQLPFLLDLCEFCHLPSVDALVFDLFTETLVSLPPQQTENCYYQTKIFSEVGVLSLPRVYFLCWFRYGIYFFNEISGSIFNCLVAKEKLIEDFYYNSFFEWGKNSYHLTILNSQTNKCQS